MTRAAATMLAAIAAAGALPAAAGAAEGGPSPNTPVSATAQGQNHGYSNSKLAPSTGRRFRLETLLWFIPDWVSESWL